MKINFRKQEDVPFYGNDYFDKPGKFRCVGDCFEYKMLLHFGNLARERDLARPYDLLRANWERSKLQNPNNDYEPTYQQTLRKWELAKDVLRTRSAEREQKYHY